MTLKGQYALRAVNRASFRARHENLAEERRILTRGYDGPQLLCRSQVGFRLLRVKNKLHLWLWRTQTVITHPWLWLSGNPQTVRAPSVREPHKSYCTVTRTAAYILVTEVGIAQQYT